MTALRKDTAAFPGPSELEKGPVCGVAGVLCHSPPLHQHVKPEKAESGMSIHR